MEYEKYFDKSSGTDYFSFSRRECKVHKKELEYFSQ